MLGLTYDALGRPERGGEVSGVGHPRERVAHWVKRRSSQAIAG